MKKTVLAVAAAATLAFSGPALAACEGELQAAEADLAAAQLDETMQMEAAQLVEEARASLEAGDEEACMDAVSQITAMSGTAPDAAPDGAGTTTN